MRPPRTSTPRNCCTSCAERRLADGRHHHVAFDGDMRIGNRHQRLIHLLHLHRIEQQAPTLIRPDRQRLTPPQKLHAFLLGMFVFKVKCGHVAFAATIEQVNRLRAEAARGIGGIDRGVACAHHHDRAVDLAKAPGFVGRDQFERIQHALLILAGNIQPLHRAQADAEKDEVELRLQALPAPRRIRSLAPNRNSTPMRRIISDFAQAVGGAQLVLGNAIGVQPARQRRRSMMVADAPWRQSSAAQASDAGPPPMQATCTLREPRGAVSSSSPVA